MSRLLLPRRLLIFCEVYYLVGNFSPKIITHAAQKKNND